MVILDFFLFCLFFWFFDFLTIIFYAKSVQGTYALGKVPRRSGIRPYKNSQRGRRGLHLLPSRIGLLKKGRAAHRPPTLQPPEARPHRKMGNDSWWKKRKRREKGFLRPLHRTLKRRGICRGALRPPSRATLSGFRRRMESPTPRS